MVLPLLAIVGLVFSSLGAAKGLVDSADTKKASAALMKELHATRAALVSKSVLDGAGVSPRSRPSELIRALLSPRALRNPKSGRAVQPLSARGR